MKRRDSLPRAVRLNDREAIAALAAARPLRRAQWLLIKRVSNNQGYARLVIRIANKNARRAVERHRIRRGIRESFRLQRLHLPAADYWVSLRAKPAPAEVDMIREEFERLLRLER